MINNNFNNQNQMNNNFLKLNPENQFFNNMNNQILMNNVQNQMMGNNILMNNMQMINQYFPNNQNQNRLIFFKRNDIKESIDNFMPSLMGPFIPIKYDDEIFGKKFIENNKNNYKILINGIESDLFEKNQTNYLKQLSFISIEIREIHPITDMSEMFRKDIDISLRKISDSLYLFLSEWDTSNVTNMSHMFEDCKNLPFLFISNLNTSNVKDMSYMFYGCNHLSYLDISKWNTSNVINMSYMFSSCLSLPDISNLNTSNVTDMSFMFKGCKSKILPDISKWNTSNVTDMCGMFKGCIN